MLLYKLKDAIIWRSPEPFRTVLGSIGFESETVPEPFKIVANEFNLCSPTYLKQIKD